MAYRRATRRRSYSTRRASSSYRGRSRRAGGSVRRRRSYGSARTVRIVIEQPGASLGRLDQVGIGMKAASSPRKATF